MKFKTTKFSSEGLGGNCVKFCTSYISHYNYGMFHTTFMFYECIEGCPVLPQVVLGFT